MNKDETKSRIRKEGGKLILEIIKKDQEPKVLFEDINTYSNLDKLRELFDLEDVDELLTLALEGDESTIEIDREFDTGRVFDIEFYSTKLKEFEMELPENLSKEIHTEMTSNFQKDLAASAIEKVYEDLVYKLFGHMHTLVIDTLEIEDESLKSQQRLVTIIFKHAPLVDIKVNLK